MIVEKLKPYKKNNNNNKTKTKTETKQKNSGPSTQFIPTISEYPPSSQVTKHVAVYKMRHLIQFLISKTSVRQYCYFL